VLLVYGAYGYTGALVARHAVERGLRPVLAGRDPGRLAALAGPLGLAHRAFGLDDPRALDAGLAGATVVLHCAGPFSRTARPMVEACLRVRAHYLDITGELAVFEALHARSAEAARAGVMVLPGAGFDVVPSDGLAAHLARRLPGATRLTLAFQGLSHLSRGTARTMVEGLGATPAARRSRQPATRTVDLGRGPRRALSIPWGDVFTAPLSTGIEDVAVYVPVPPALALVARLLAAAAPLGAVAAPVARLGPVRDLAVALLTRGKPGPDEAERARGGSRLWGEVADGRGGVAAARMRTANGYAFTALSAVEIARRALGGDAKPGFQTPSTAYGPDLALAIPGTSREDL
jgi:short subunit dehydrogenase-like uncharacterized protein